MVALACRNVQLSFEQTISVSRLTRTIICDFYFNKHHKEYVIYKEGKKRQLFRAEVVNFSYIKRLVT